MIALGYRRRLGVAALLVVAVGLLATGCSSSGGAAPTAASSPSSNSSILPTPPGTVPDSIEDVNSNKDMTGVATTLSRDANPYNELIPYVCPFLPDSLTRDKLGMVDKSTGLGGKHTLLQFCTMTGPSGSKYEQLGITVTIQSVSYGDVFATPTHTTLDPSVKIWRGISGVLYKNAGDDTVNGFNCNLAWGTFYGSAVVTVIADAGYPADPCAKAREFAPLIAPFLPSRPSQMRPSEA